MTSVEHTSCGICHEDIDAKTGVLKTSCAHVFHPKCLWKWYSTNEANTCPMCRTPATEWEALTSTEEEATHVESDSVIRITRVGMEQEIVWLGGYGLSASAEAELGGFDEYGESIVSLQEFQRILRGQGVGHVWDNEWWNRLLSLYPAHLPAPQGAPPALAAVEFTEPLRPLLYHTPHHACPMEYFPAGDIPPNYGVGTRIPCDVCDAHTIVEPFYHCAACRFDICESCFDVIHSPGPFDFPDSSFTLRRGDVEGLLRAHGSRATMVEFFNEEDGEEETLVVTMTLESLNARFASLGATPVVAAELQPDRLGAVADRLGAVADPRPRRAIAPGQNPYNLLTTFVTVLFIMLW